MSDLKPGWAERAGAEAGRREREMRLNSQRQKQQQGAREWAEYVGNERKSVTPPPDPGEEWLKGQKRAAQLNADAFALEVRKC